MVIKTSISKTTKVFKSLCTPARIEFILTIIGAIATIITCFASFSETKYQAVCNNILPSTIVSGIFIWILNALCKGGAGIISWILVVGPLFIMLFAIFFGKSKEEFGLFDGIVKAAAAKKAAEDEDEEDEDEDEDGVEARARAIVKAREEFSKKIKEIQKEAIVIAKKAGSNKALIAKIHFGTVKKIETLKKNLLNYEAKIRAKGDWEEVLERVKAIQDEAKAKAAKAIKAFWGSRSSSFLSAAKAVKAAKAAKVAKKEGEGEGEEEEARKARALAKLRKDIADIQKRAAFAIKLKGGDVKIKAKIQVMAKNQIEVLKKAFEINEANIAAKRKVGVYATKSNVPKSKELIELEKKLAKLNFEIAKQTKKCVDKCINKKLKKELKKLKEQIKDEISDTKAENPDFS